MKTAVILLVVFVLTGCSVLLPYEDSFLCNIPREQGMCGSISDVYEETLK